MEELSISNEHLTSQATASRAPTTKTYIRIAGTLLNLVVQLRSEHDGSTGKLAAQRVVDLQREIKNTYGPNAWKRLENAAARSNSRDILVEGPDDDVDK